jgi:plasmid maintenance system antidote protein VapI
MDLWLDPDPANVERANAALVEFGSPHLLDPADREEVVQLGVAPNRIALLRNPGDLQFDVAWKRRIESQYGRSRAFWIDLDSLIEIKGGIDHPRHQDDARVLRQVRDQRADESEKA